MACLMPCSPHYSYSLRRTTYVHEDLGWKWSVLKNGKRGNRLLPEFGPPYLPLYQCDVCGRVSTPHNIHGRSDIYCWNWLGKLGEKMGFGTVPSSRDCLCMACWNRVRALVKRRDQCEDTLRLIRKIERSWYVQQNQNDRAATGIPRICP